VGKNKKGPNKQIALKHNNRQKEDIKISQKGMMTKTKEISEHKKHEQEGKVVIIGLL
jgi:hypothetical protein